MSNDDLVERLERLRAEGGSQEEKEVLLRNTVRDPLRMMTGTCRLLLQGEFGGLSKGQVDAVRRVLRYAEIVEEAIDLHLEVQGITIGWPSKKCGKMSRGKFIF